MNKVFEDYGIEIYKENNKYYVRFDIGELVGKFVDVEITEEEAKIAQRSGNDAYSLLVKLDKSNRIRR